MPRPSALGGATPRKKKKNPLASMPAFAPPAPPGGQGAGPGIGGMPNLAPPPASPPLATNTTQPRLPAFSPAPGGAPALGGAGAPGASLGPAAGMAPSAMPSVPGGPGRGGIPGGGMVPEAGWPSPPPSPGGTQGSGSKTPQPSWGRPAGNDYSDPAKNTQAGEQHPWISDQSLPWWQKGRGMSPTYFGDIPGMLGRGQIESILSDPYGYMMTDAPLRGKLGEADQAYNIARQRLGASAGASGAEGSGVARGLAGNVEGARASDISSTMRDWEKLKLQMGDQRIQQFLFPWLSAANTNLAASQGQQAPPGGTDWGGVGGGIGSILGGIGSFFQS